MPPTIGSHDPTWSALGNRLFRHYRARPEGRNVYILSDGTVTELDPDQETMFWDRADGSPYVVVALYGGHDSYEVTSAQATLLTNAGYTVT